MFYLPLRERRGCVSTGDASGQTVSGKLRIRKTFASRELLTKIGKSIDIVAIYNLNYFKCKNDANISFRLSLKTYPTRCDVRGGRSA